jgi:adenylate cyclase
VQDAIEERNTDDPWDDRMLFRIGIHLGDAIVRGKNLFGTAVNIASRLEGLADPGSICVSAAVRNEIWNKIPTIFIDLGEQCLKNIREPVRTYRVRGNIKDEKPPTKTPNISSAKSSGPVALVRYTISDVQVDQTVRGKINVVFKNNGPRSAVLQKI